jgi:hypothetical protein
MVSNIGIDFRQLTWLVTLGIQIEWKTGLALKLGRKKWALSDSTKDIGPICLELIITVGAHVALAGGSYTHKPHKIQENRNNKAGRPLKMSVRYLLTFFVTFYLVTTVIRID